MPPDQKVLSTSVTFNNEIFFVAFSPDTASAETCAAGRGRNFLSGLARVERPCGFHAIVLVQDGHHVAKQTAGETGSRGISDEEELGHEVGGYRPAE